MYFKEIPGEGEENHTFFPASYDNNQKLLEGKTVLKTKFLIILPTVFYLFYIMYFEGFYVEKPKRVICNIYTTLLTHTHKYKTQAFAHPKGHLGIVHLGSCVDSV